MATLDAGAEGGGRAKPVNSSGVGNTNGNNGSSGAESDNLYSVLGLPVGSTAAEIKVQVTMCSTTVVPGILANTSRLR